MTVSSDAAPTIPSAPIHLADGAYVPGTCNIGPWEVRKRRSFAIVTLAIGVAALVVLLATGAPVPLRLALLLPFWSGAFSWLQARRRFCAGFAVAGLSNFGDGEASRRRVTDAAAHRRDLGAVGRMARDSFAIALVATLVTLLIPR